jgi:protein involved in ribonucleotide reduction
LIIVYDSLTGQGKKFASKLGYKAVNIKDYQSDDDPVVFLVTRSFNFGEIPKTTYNFLKAFHNRVIGTAVSGNRNWGTNFGKAGELIEKEFGIPLVTKFEMGGFDNDIKTTKNFLETFS